jgi:hypothetical protein
MKLVFLILLSLSFQLSITAQNTSLLTATNVCNGYIFQTPIREGLPFEARIILNNCANTNDWHYFNITLYQTQNLGLIAASAGQFQYELYGSFAPNTSLAIKQNAITSNIPLHAGDVAWINSNDPNTNLTWNNINFVAGEYVLRIKSLLCPFAEGGGVAFLGNLSCNAPSDCQTCITSFSPQPGKYMVSAWVKEENAAVGTLNYSNSKIAVTFNGSAPTNLVPSGQIIDGWQRIEGELVIPAGSTTISVALTNMSGVSFFDDIRFFPFDGSMMSYVYDPETLRLVAELDERNYATFYEYDEEGKLIRVKKETERGVMTIQENRNNTKKQ